MKKKDRMVTKLVCHARSLTYVWATRRGDLYLPDGECCDMSGCINLFLGIDTNVEDIQTWAGPKEDVRYVLHGGDWKAKSPPGTAP